MSNIFEINRPNNTIAFGTIGTITSIGFKHTAGSQASPIDVTNTRQHGFELHYSGNDYNITGIRSRAQLVTTDTSASAQGALLQAANNDGINAGVLNGALIEAIGKSSANAATISTMRGALVGAEWGAFDTVTNLKTLHIRTHSLNNAGAGSFGIGYGLYVENEAVGGNGQALDAGIYFKGTSLSAGNKAFTHGIDFSGGTYTTAEIKLSNGETISNLVDGQVFIDGDIATDQWLNSDFNAFLGIDVCGAGNLAHSAGVEGWYNTFIGYKSGFNIIAGSVNTGVGAASLSGVTVGVKNTGVGDNVLLSLSAGNYHTAVGQDAGKAVSTVDGGVFLGYSAGRYETAANKLFIDNAPRANEADGRAKALIYGVFDAVTANQSLRFNAEVAITDGLILAKTSGVGIKVDTTTPTFPWRDLLGDQFSKNTGGTKPTLTAYNGAVDAWQFSDGDEAFLTYHIPHDYVAGTDIHLHIHWSQNNAGATGGTIDFIYTAIYAKGHNQVSGSTFTSTPKTDSFSSIDINDGDSGLDQYQHHLTEVIISAATATAALFDRDDFEPDGVIELTLEMDANNLTGTPSDPFIHYVDIHYQSTGIGTKDKVPDFYA